MDNYESLRLENQVCFPLYACAKEVVRQYRKPLEKLGLTYTQYIVMMVLWEHGGMTEGEIGKKVHLDSGTLAPLLKRLEKQGYISRSRQDADERSLFVELTEEGTALKDNALKVPSEIEGFLQLPKEDITHLKRILDRAVGLMWPDKP